MKTRTLTFAEAKAIASDPDTELFQMPRLIDEETVMQFLGQYHRAPASVVPKPFFIDAENEAMNLLAGYDASIEIDGFHSIDHNPHTLRLTPDMFSWEIAE